MTLPTVQVFGKPIEKLIDTVSKGIGTIYKPKAIRNEADAKAYEIEKIAGAKAKASIIMAEADNTVAERARQRLFYQEMQRQNNLDNIVEKTASNLLENVSEVEVDDDWRTKFFNKAQDVTSEELQSVWAKILANEINQPGKTSVRTLDILSNMSKLEATKFQLLSSICTVHGNIFKIKDLDLLTYGLSYDDLCLLRSAGLLLTSDTMNVTYKTNIKTKPEGSFGIILSFSKNIHLFVSKENSTDPTGKFILEQFSLTLAGEELLPIISNSTNYIYLDDLKKKLADDGYLIEDLSRHKN